MTATRSTPFFLMRSSVEAGASALAEPLAAAIAAPASATVVRASLRFMVSVSLESGSDRVRPLDYFCIQDKMQYGISTCWPFGRQGRNEPNILAGLRKIPDGEGL